MCAQCDRIAYADWHQCPRQQQQQGGVCARCEGPHAPELPCFIQPLEGARPIQQQNVAEDGDDDNTNDDGEQLPIRLCFFDAETSQDEPLHLQTQIAQKHVPLLIVAEVICERCIRAGIQVHDGHGRRAQGCVCGTARGPRMRQWCSPPFLNAANDVTPRPPGAPTYNFRRLYFHSFDDAAANPVDQFLDFLTKHGPQRSHTICLAHNGGKYDFHLILEALHLRSLPAKRLCTTGLKIYSMRLGGNNQRRITFKDSLNYFFCELDALPKSFKLPAELATPKPYFPYLFIRRRHLLERLQGLPPRDAYAEAPKIFGVV